MPTIAPPVDDNGNITIPAEGGVVIPLKEQTNAEPPVQINISALPLKFLVKNRLDITPGVDPNDALGRLLTITETQADQIGTAGHSFQLLDMTTPTVPVVLWSGTIRRGE